MVRFLSAFAGATLLLLQLASALEYPAECGRPPFHCDPWSPERLQIMDRETQQQVLTDLLESPHQITEAELRGLCKVFVDSYACEANHTVRCLPAPLQSIIQGLFSRTLSLTGVCDRPDFFTKAQILLDCVQSTLRVYRKYTQEERRSFDRQTEKCQLAIAGATGFVASSLQPVSREPLVFHNESALLTGACCRWKKIVSCLPRVALIRQECTFEAVDLGRTILRGLSDYYKCPDTLATNICPEINERRPFYPLHQDYIHSN